MKNNKIQFITSYPLHHEPVIKNRVVPFIRVAVKNGYQVVLISPDNKTFKVEGVDFKHILSPDEVTKPTSFVKRMFFEIKQARRLIKKAVTEGANVRVLTVPSMFLLFNASLFGKHEFTTDLRDLTWEYVPELNVFTKMAKKIFRFFAKYNIKRSRFINVTNETEKEYLLNKFGVKQDVLLVPNGVSDEQYNRLSKVSIKPDPAPSVAYIGNVGLAQNLTNLVRVAKKTPKIQYTIVGEGTDFKSIKELVYRENLPNLKLTGRLQWDEVIDIYENVNVLYAQLSPDFSSAMPSKLYEYLSTGKYIIYGGQEQAQTILSGFDNNTVIEPCNEEQLKDAIVNATETSLHLNMSTMNKNLIKEKYIRENAIQKMFNYLKDKNEGSHNGS
nr:glycosyltransferase [uncultured Glaciecola sp.]